MLFQFYGPWEATWRHRGMEKLLMDIALQPDWVQEMGQTYMGLVIDILEYCLGLGMKPDGICMVEDLGSTRSMLFSPASWKNVFKPVYMKLGRFLDAEEIDFWMHSCGAVGPVIDELLDCGLDVLNPLQANAGLDVIGRQDLTPEVHDLGMRHAFSDSTYDLIRNQGDCLRMTELDALGSVSARNLRSLASPSSFSPFGGQLPSPSRVRWKTSLLKPLPWQRKS